MHNIYATNTYERAYTLTYEIHMDTVGSNWTAICKRECIEDVHNKSFDWSEKEKNCNLMRNSARKRIFHIWHIQTNRGRARKLCVVVVYNEWTKKQIRIKIYEKNKKKKRKTEGKKKEHVKWRRWCRICSFKGDWMKVHSMRMVFVCLCEVENSNSWRCDMST